MALSIKTSASETDLVVSFQINGRIHDIEFGQGEEELYNQLLDDNEYTLEYLNSLITTGVISIDGNLEEIYRVNSKGDLEDKIFPVEFKSIISEYKDKWHGPETCLLMEKYELYIQQVGATKKFPTKRCMWGQIAKDIENTLQLNKTSIQVENRFKTLLRKKEFEVKYNKASDLDDDCKEKIRRVLLQRPPKRKYNTKYSLCNNEPEGRETSLQDVLEKIHREKEEAKERRHREKLTLLRKHEAAKERRHTEKLEMMNQLLQAKMTSAD